MGKIFTSILLIPILDLEVQIMKYIKKKMTDMAYLELYILNARKSKWSTTLNYALQESEIGLNFHL